MLQAGQQIKIEGNIGACLVGLGRLKQAHARFIKAVDLARKHHDPAAESMWLVSLGRLNLDQGRPADADRYARASIRIAKPREHLLGRGANLS